MKKMIFLLIFIIAITENLNSQAGSCEWACIQAAYPGFYMARNNQFACQRGCNVGGNAKARNWLDKLECMITGGCEEEDREEAELDQWCLDSCDVEFQACMEYLAQQYDECMNNCI